MPRPAAVMSRKEDLDDDLYVTPEQSERLRLLHERTKVPVAVYIRERDRSGGFASTGICFPVS